MDPYQQLAAALAADGIRCYFQQPGQMVVSAQSGPAWPDRGNSFWMTRFGGHWHLFTWSPVGYRIPEEADVAQLCRACMAHGTSAMSVAPSHIIQQFGLAELSHEQADAVFEELHKHAPPGSAAKSAESRAPQPTAAMDAMSITVESINHVGLVVKDLEAAERFYVDVLGLKRHHVRRSWFVLNAASTLHLIPLADAAAVDPPHHAYRHVALQVPDLRAALRLLLAGNVRVLQVDFSGDEREVTSLDDPLDFGVGSLFVRDPDGNLIEFLQLGHGLFTPDMQPRIAE